MRTRYPATALDDDDSKTDAKAGSRRPSLACPRRPLLVIVASLVLLLLLLLGISGPSVSTTDIRPSPPGLTISPSAVAAGATVSFAVAGLEAGEELRFAPINGGATVDHRGLITEVYATLAANASVTLALPTVATYSVWRVAGGLTDTGLRVVAAEPWPPEPTQSAVSDGAVLSFFAHNFPERLMAGAGSGVTSEVAPLASDDSAPAVRLRRQASFRLRLQRCPNVQRGDFSEVRVLTLCAPCTHGAHTVHAPCIQRAYSVHTPCPAHAPCAPYAHTVRSPCPTHAPCAPKRTSTMEARLATLPWKAATAQGCTMRNERGNRGHVPGGAVSSGPISSASL